MNSRGSVAKVGDVKAKTRLPAAAKHDIRMMC
jgi:ribosomal protein S30